MTLSLDELLDNLESRTEYVVSLTSDTESTMDTPDDTNAFAFVLYADGGNMLVVEGRVTGDNKEAVVTVWSAGEDGQLTPTVSELAGTVMITQAL